MKKYLTPLVSLFLIAIVGIGGMLLWQRSRITDSQLQNQHQLLVSILPQQQIVERIAGKGFTTSVLIPPGFSPETYEPTTQDMKQVANSEVYFRIGYIPFEIQNMNRLQEVNPSMILVDTSKLNTTRVLEAHHHDDEDVHDIHEEEGGIDPHVWLSPVMVKQQAQVIHDTLVDRYPNLSAQFDQNFKELSQELDDLDQELRQAFAPIKGKTMLVYHPAFGYLADEYGFTQEYIQIEGKDPSITDLQEVILEAKNDGVKVIFVQKQFSQDTAKAVADNIGGVVVQIDPLDPDYLGTITAMAKTIQEHIQ